MSTPAYMTASRITEVRDGVEAAPCGAHPRAPQVVDAAAVVGGMSMKRGWALAALLVAYVATSGTPPPSEFRCTDDTACATGISRPGTLTCVRADDDVGRVRPPITPDAEPHAPTYPDVDASAASLRLLDARTPDPLDAAPADAGPPMSGRTQLPACQAEADPIPEAAGWPTSPSAAPDRQRPRGCGPSAPGSGR
ncbi:MAG: hypothetical protein R3F43_13175 [bacterium]